MLRKSFRNSRNYRCHRHWSHLRQQGRRPLPATGFSFDRSANSGGTPAERKVLFWYDAMNAAHHYDKPGKGSRWHGPGA